ncbi:methyltransferase domain-containing protein [Viridibacillus sp. YIM B01967]|uniref:Methyltransferase domain-containing protein n=1 Tax=Viridibacillus soli TaxID=2798301 RepID=A0ABS1H8Q1_9BACL|nr:class I SAM-dependent methyltransferase [Viridibacillus soli]MBK3495800.1 methyltransferase domain-containing protein [Viridibacillus soli]
MITEGRGKVDFEQIWQEGMKDWSGRMPERMINDTLEEQFWAKYIEKNAGKEPDPYAEGIFKIIAPFIAQSDTVLEIGPGWGNYTFPLAKHVEKLTCVDSSASMIEYLQRKCDDDGYNNISFIHEKWEDYNKSEQYDIVFGMNCFYRIYEIKRALQQIHTSAKKLAIIGVTFAPMRPHYIDLHNKFGYALKYPRRDYIDLMNILYELDIHANCQIVNLEKTYTYNSYDEMIHANSVKLLTPNIERAQVEEAVKNYVEFKEGRYHYKHQFKAAILYWHPSFT